MQIDILQNIICTADPEAIARNWEFWERIDYYPAGFHLEPSLLEKEIERLKREIVAFQERLSKLRPVKGDSEWVAIAGVYHWRNIPNYQDVPRTHASFYKKSDLEILFAEAIEARIPDKIEKDGSIEYYNKVLQELDSSQRIIHGHYVTGKCCSLIPLEEVVGAEVFPSNLKRHDKDAFAADILSEISFDDRHICDAPGAAEWKSDPEVEAAKARAGQEYKDDFSAETIQKELLQRKKDLVQATLDHIAEYRQLYKEAHES